MTNIGCTDLRGAKVKITQMESNPKCENTYNFLKNLKSSSRLQVPLSQWNRSYANYFNKTARMKL